VIEPELEIDFSEKLSSDVINNIMINITNDGLGTYFKILHGSGLLDSSSRWFCGGCLFDKLNIVEVDFPSNDKLVIKFHGMTGTHRDMGVFMQELSAGRLYLQIDTDIPAEDSAFMDAYGNKVPSNNAPSKIKGSGTSLNLICEVRQVNNPSGRSSPDPFRRFYIGLNPGVLSGSANGSAGEQPTHYDVEFQIYDLLGNLVWYREEKFKAEEINDSTDLVIEINWDYKNMKGRYVASGGYLGMIRVFLQPMGTVAKHPPLKIVVRE
jgi:hypothetical protein